MAVIASTAALKALNAQGPPPEQGPEQVTIAPGGEGPVSWNDVDQLISEQKFEAASEAVTAIRERAREAGDAGEWTRALVEETKLRMALHGYETSVRFLKDQPWPDDAVSRAVLDLFYANSLVTYVHAYSWEIRQRERVETSGELDLKKWDLEQILEAQQADLQDVVGHPAVPVEHVVPAPSEVQDSGKVLRPGKIGTRHEPEVIGIIRG